MATGSKLNPLMVLQARAEARALLHAAGEFTIEEATEPLYCYAIESGLVVELGIARVRDIIEVEFGVDDDEAVP
jgi:hypothetical protein